MSPRFEMLILRGLLRIAYTTLIRSQLIRLRALERKIVRQDLENTSTHELRCAIMINHILGVRAERSSSHMVSGWPRLKWLQFAATQQFSENPTPDESQV